MLNNISQMTSLPTNSSLSKIVDRVNLITNARQIERDYLSDLLISKNIPISADLSMEELLNLLTTLKIAEFKQEKVMVAGNTHTLVSKPSFMGFYCIGVACRSYGIDITLPKDIDRVKSAKISITTLVEDDTLDYTFCTRWRVVRNGVTVHNIYTSYEWLSGPTSRTYTATIEDLQDGDVVQIDVAEEKCDLGESFGAPSAGDPRFRISLAEITYDVVTEKEVELPNNLVVTKSGDTNVLWTNPSFDIYSGDKKTLSYIVPKIPYTINNLKTKISVITKNSYKGVDMFYVRARIIRNGIEVSRQENIYQPYKNNYITDYVNQLVFTIDYPVEAGDVIYFDLSVNLPLQLTPFSYGISSTYYLQVSSIKLSYDIETVSINTNKYKMIAGDGNTLVGDDSSSSIYSYSSTEVTRALTVPTLPNTFESATITMDFKSEDGSYQIMPYVYITRGGTTVKTIQPDKNQREILFTKYIRDYFTIKYKITDFALQEGDVINFKFMWYSPTSSEKYSTDKEDNIEVIEGNGGKAVAPGGYVHIKGVYVTYDTTNKY